MTTAPTPTGAVAIEPLLIRCFFVYSYAHLSILPYGMFTTFPLAGRTSMALSLSLNVNTAFVWCPLASGTFTLRKETSSVTPMIDVLRQMRRANKILLTVLKVYRSLRAIWVDDLSGREEDDLSVTEVVRHGAGRAANAHKGSNSLKLVMPGLVEDVAGPDVSGGLGGKVESQASCASSKWPCQRVQVPPSMGEIVAGRPEIRCM